MLFRSFEKNRKISKAEFSKQLATKTLLLNLKSQLLFTHDHFYLNGEKLVVPAEINEAIKHLADKKYLTMSALQPQGLSPQNIPAQAGYSCVKPNIHAACSDCLYEAYLAGYICFKHR